MLYFEPRPGPEWGSGGVFGLKHHRGVLYFTLSMEAEAHFVYDGGGETVYRFELLGPGPASGGDTYNAVAAVDDFIYFGGWVHNPAVFKGRVGRGGEIDFRNKYSHVHEFDASERRVRLVWKDGLGREREWAGEVSEIVYDPLGDRLLLARADGMANLGVYSLDRRGGRAERLSDVPALKGSLFLDYACFDMQPDWRRGVDGVQCLDLYEGRLHAYRVADWAASSADGWGVEGRGSGYAISAYARYWHFFRGGLLVGNPVEPEAERPTFVRLFDFPGYPYAPHRSNAIALGGGILAPFNSLSHGFIHGPGGAPREANEPVGPSVLVYISPPVAKIVAALGARVTSVARKGGSVLLGTSTAPNLGGLDATLVDPGIREIVEVPEGSLLLSSPPPLEFRVSGRAVGQRPFGGVPLAGYSEAWALVRASKENRLEVAEYDVGLPPELHERYAVELRPGPNKIDLSGHGGLVSFRLERPDEGLVVRLVLEP